MIEHVLAGEPGNQVRAEAVPVRGPCPDGGLVVPDPAQFRADRLRREMLSTLGEHRRWTVLGVELLDLRSGAPVDAVEDRRPQRLELVIGNDEARTHGAHAHPEHVGSVVPREELRAQPTDLAKSPLGVELGPIGARKGDLVADPSGIDHDSIGRRDDGLCASRTDVDAEVQRPVRHQRTC